MGAKEAFLEKVCEYLLSLPFDLKILQEAVADPDLDRHAREVAAGTIIHTILPQEGEAPGRYVDDVFLVRAALHYIGKGESEGAQAFRDRFTDVYDALTEDEKLFTENLGDLWPWLTGKLESFPKQVFKGKKPVQFVDDDEAATLLYEEGLEFQTNYPVKEEQVHNKIRRVETIIELLNKRRADEAKKKT